MNAGIPKQFLLLGEEPLLMHTIRVFSQTYPGLPVIVALPPDQKQTWDQLCRDHAFNLPHRVTDGGETRFYSVKNCLAVLPDEGWVAIHDGARPLVTCELIQRTFEEALLHGNAVPVLPVSESLRQVTGDTHRPVNRQEFYLVQTPQVFATSFLKNAYDRDPLPEFTDDATVAEAAGATIHLFAGERNNIKITLPEELLLARMLFAGRRPH